MKIRLSRKALMSKEGCNIPSLTIEEVDKSYKDFVVDILLNEYFKDANSGGEND